MEEISMHLSPILFIVNSVRLFVLMPMIVVYLPFNSLALSEELDLGLSSNKAKEPSCILIHTGIL
jgi:hypothetical protein